MVEGVDELEISDKKPVHYLPIIDKLSIGDNIVYLHNTIYRTTAL